jgi:DNA-binding response OmpR family regulator/predicted  nucleic acid-binding Zn-ribbon protein
VPKRILVIDSDEAFAQGLASAIKARGFAASMATDSEKGMSIARKDAPDLIVVCVEAQPTNGYMLCTRLKKDEQLKGIPVILTSANATQDSFEKHKKLKTRAEEYLIKPFAPSAVLEKASKLLGVRNGAPAAEDEPLALGDLAEGEDEPISLSAHDVAEARSALNEEALVVEEVEEVVEIQEEGSDDELEMFDKAFDSLGSPSSGPIPATTSRFADNPGKAPGKKAEPKEPTELSAPDDDAVLDSLVAEEEEVDFDPPAPAPEAKGKPDKEVDRLKKELQRKEKELVRLQEQAEKLKDDATKREAAAKTLQQRADALAAAAKKFERELAEAKKGASEELRGRLKELESELESATSEKETLSNERDDLKRQLEEAQASAGQNENRAVKAYARIKNEEKLREKARKALEIALQLLGTGSDNEDDEEAKKTA